MPLVLEEWVGVSYAGVLPNIGLTMLWIFPTIVSLFSFVGADVRTCNQKRRGRYRSSQNNLMNDLHGSWHYGSIGYLIAVLK
jgi:hypothetical protein